MRFSPVFIVVLFSSSALLAADAPISGDTVVATVGEEPIHAKEVQRLQEKAAKGKELAPQAVALLQAKLLKEIIDRRLALMAAKRNGEAATAKEIDKAFSELKTQLAARQKTVEDFRKEQSISDEELRRQLAWNIYWKRVEEKELTPKRLQEYFDAHHRDFDGTELIVSHILFRPTDKQQEKNKDDLLERAETVRKELQTQKISFADAAQQFSAGETRNDGGKLGAIGRHGSMDAAFTRAAFALKPGEISRPVRTAFGVHLILVEEEKPGKKQLADVENEVRDATAREVLGKIAEAERSKTKVKYSDKFPHVGCEPIR
jgi:parvulin-like peptidyl-prolyl isomerase